MAESSIITCPECRKKFKSKGNLAGKKIKCPLCTKAFVVPGGNEPAKTPAPATASVTAAPAPGPLGFAAEEEDDGKAYGVTHLDLAPRCPNCAQLMEDEKAFICLYCGYNSLTREVGRTEKTISHTTGERFMHLLPGLVSVLAVFLLVAGMTYYSVVLPQIVFKSKLDFFDHESLRMWFTIIVLSLIWGCGLFAYKRLVVQPRPPEKVKEK